MNNLLKAKNRTNSEESRIRINERIANMQATLANELEMKEKAMQIRINNFYKTNTGKMVPTTFNCIKEKVKHKDIQDITVGGRQINKNEDIVREMQNWYQETANNMQEQTMSLNEFLQNNNVTNLPQITSLHFTSKKLYFVIITVHNISLKNIFKKTQSYMVYDNFLGEPAERVFIFLINPLPHPVHPRPPAFI